jgi:DNA polymerase III delta subunit
MKLYPSEANKIIQLISAQNIKAILLYGPETSLINNYVTNLSKALKYTVKSICYSDLINSEDFHIVFSNLNLFSKKEIIKIYNVPSALNKNLEKFLLEQETFNFPIIIAKEATASSSISKFFMQNKAFASVVFYEQDINYTHFILQDLKPKEVTQGAVEAIKDLASCNSILLKQEIEKIKLLTHDKSCITREDIVKLPTYLTKQSLDTICRSLIMKDANQYFQLISEHIQNYTPAILIIRSIEKYYLNLYIVLKSNKSIKDASQSIKPPIFFKNFNNFLDIANKIKLNNVIKSLSVLYKFETLLKTSHMPDKSLLEKLYYDVNH